MLVNENLNLSTSISGQCDDSVWHSTPPPNG